jgi:RHS repeat-associated protein
MTKTVGGVTQEFVWDVSGPTPRLISDGNAEYLYGPSGSPVEQIPSSGQPAFYHHDQLGSTRLLTQGSPPIQTTSFAYDSFGNTVQVTGSDSTPFQYAGEYRDSESDFYYLRARYFDPSTAQFLTVDPAFTNTRNRYGYVNDNPLNSTDPSGLFPPFDEIGAVSGAIVGGVVGGVTTAVTEIGNNDFNLGSVLVATGAGAAGGAVEGFLVTDCGFTCAGAAGGAVSGAINGFGDALLSQDARGSWHDSWGRYTSTPDAFHLLPGDVFNDFSGGPFDRWFMHQFNGQQSKSISLSCPLTGPTYLSAPSQ